MRDECRRCVACPGAVRNERPWIPPPKVKAELTNRRELIRQRYGLSRRPSGRATDKRQDRVSEVHSAALVGEEATEGSQCELGSHVAVAERSLECEEFLHFTSHRSCKAPTHFGTGSDSSRSLPRATRM